jgi:surface protein
MKNYLFTIVGVLCMNLALAQNEFITTWKTDNPGTSNDNQITIPTTGIGYSYDIDWGDGSNDTGVTGDITHTYSTAGTYTVSISGDFPRIYFTGTGDKDKILSIEQWGDIAWKDMSLAFFGCSNLTYNAIDVPNLSDVNNLYAMFFQATLFNGEIGNWDVSNVTNMQSLFGSTAFDQDISSWDVSNVTNFSQIFFDSPFNQDISNWDVSNAMTMQNMFGGNSAFNQDISNWNVSNVENFASAFSNATSFNQDVSSWNVVSATDMANMFNNSGLSTVNYDKILTSWSTQAVQSGVSFSAFGVEYCLGAAGRNTLETTHSWTITDAGENCVVNIPDENFLNALINLGIDTDVSGDISYQEAAVVNDLQMASQGITDLTGIEAFTALSTLNVNNNSITSIEVSNNTALTILSATANSITTVDLSNNTALESLNLNINPLGELDISNQPSLLNLYCRSCQLSALDVSANTALEVMIINNNNFTTIDLGNNGDLKTLNIQNNNLTALDISNNTMLESLTAFSNNITAIDLSNNINLVNVSLSSNPITALDFSSNTLLADLSVSNCSLTSLDLSTNSALVELFAINNDLTELDIANGNNSNFVEFKITGNPNLTCVTVDDIAFAEANFTDIDETTNFSTDCNVVDIPDDNFKDALLANTSINTNEDAFIQVAEAEAFNASLNVANSSIADLTGIEAFVNITALNASGNTAISSLDLSNNTELTNVQVQDCSLSEGVDLSMQTKLGFLSLSGNDLTELDLSQNILLQDLRLSSNNLTSLDLSANPEIKFLRVSNNQLTSLNITGLSNLQQLFASNNELSGSLDLSIYSDLTAVRIEQNNLSEIDLRNGNNTAITNFNATTNPILSCISVDDVAYAEANFTNIDETTSFSTNCDNTATEITAFSFAEQTGAANIGSGTIEIEVEAGSDLSDLIPTFTVSTGATANPESGISQDFSNEFTYTITAENPNEVQEWTVMVQEQNAAPTDISLTNNVIDENNGLNEVIGTFSSEDLNTNDTHSYSLVMGSGDEDNASFEISGNELLANEVFDFETQNSFSIRVQSNDGNGGNFEKIFSISINDLAGAAQSITFNELEEKSFGDADFELSATATSGLTITYSSSDESVATVSNNQVTILAVGTTTITASQGGNEDYNAADNVEQVLTVNKGDQNITFEVLQAKTYGDADFELTATASSGLDLSYSSSDESVASISGSNVTIVGTGTTTISASQTGNENYNAATESRELVIEKADLIVTADNQNIDYGEQLPELTFTIAGFVNDEDESVLSAMPEASTTADESSDAGDYSISVEGGQTENYNIGYVEGTLTINKIDQTIAIDQIEDKLLDSPDFEVIATTTSGLELTYAVLSGPATISGNLVSLTGETGIVEIEVSQEGNINYNEAVVSTTFEVLDELCLGFEATTSVIQNVNCKGDANGSFEVTVNNGSAPFIYSLGSDSQENGLFEDVPAGTYEITVTDANGCVAVTSVEITEPDAIEVSAETTNSNSIFGNGSIILTVTGGSGNFTFDWSNGATSANLTELEIGEYTVTITDEEGCSITESYTIGGVTATEEAFELNIYPNPVIDHLEIIHEEEVSQINLMDARGKVILQKLTMGKQTHLEMKALPAGLYFLRLDNGKLNRIIKQ